MADRVLVVEDRDNLRAMIVRALASAFEVEDVATSEAAIERVPTGRFAAVLSDVRLPGGSGNDVLAAARAIPTPPEVVLMTAYADLPSAVAALRAGAYDYVAKPFEPEDIVRIVKRATERFALVNRTRELEAALDAREGSALVGQSSGVATARELIERVGPVSVPVLLLGETGTGKEVAARELHRVRGQGPWIAVNCGAIPENLIEAELFGAAKGSFTGASRDRVGLFEAADGGTLFLDEIADLPLAMQVKLNRALEEGEIRRVGESVSRPVSVRVVSATHQNLEAMVTQGNFRADLYYRLRVVEIRLPPLRERPGDLPLLAARFLTMAAARFGTLARTLEPDALAALEAHSWPGNLRELRHALESAAVMARGECITLADLPNAFRVPRSPPPTTFQEAMDRIHERAARDYLLDLLRRHRGNVTRGAEEAGVERETLHRMLKRYGVDAGGFRSRPA